MAADLRVQNLMALDLQQTFQVENLMAVDLPTKYGSQARSSRTF